jgi:IS30 family transposase
MPKQTHKRASLGDISGVLAASSTVAEAANRLGVHRSTIHRWLRVKVVADAQDEAARLVRRRWLRARSRRHRREVGGPKDPRRLLD